MFVKLPGPRHTATEEPDRLTIRIPSKRNIFVLGFLTFWLAGWCVGEISAGTALLFGAAKGSSGAGPAGFLLVWLCMWTMGGAFAILAWLWQVKGGEVITVSPTALSVQRAIFGCGPTRHYDAAEIRQLRVAPVVYNPFDFRSSMTFWGVGGGLLAFDYGFKTFRFGGGVDEAEARIILQRIVNRLPGRAEATTAESGAH